MDFEEIKLPLTRVSLRNGEGYCVFPPRLSRSRVREPDGRVYLTMAMTCEGMSLLVVSQTTTFWAITALPHSQKNMRCWSFSVKKQERGSV